MNLAQPSLVLAPKTALHNGRYVIEQVLGKPGGFGITYLARDVTLENEVAIKEYLPRDLAGRGTDGMSVVPHTSGDAQLFDFGKQEFLQETRTVANFNHANIVRVRDFFEAHGTAYMVMDYYHGQTLGEYLARKGSLSEATAVRLMLPLLDALHVVHQAGILHRDIKPANIYLAQTHSGGARPILLDFGAARVAVGERSRSLSVILTEGFAPFEQYFRRGKQGPWTDVYACAATLYFAVTGQKPPDGAERASADTLVPPDRVVAGISASFSQALMDALAVRPEQRTGSAHAFQARLMGEEPVPGAAHLDPVVPEAEQQQVMHAPQAIDPLKAKYQGVRGWLLFFCVSLTILGPLWTLINLVGGWVVAEDVILYVVGYELLLVVDTLLSMALIVLSFRAGLWLWQVKSGAVQKAKQYLKIVLGYQGLTLVLLLTFGAVNDVTDAVAADAIVGFVQGLIFFGIWFSYLNTSKRVQYTYAEV